MAMSYREATRQLASNPFSYTNNPARVLYLILKGGRNYLTLRNSKLHKIKGRYKELIKLSI